MLYIFVHIFAFYIQKMDDTFLVSQRIVNIYSKRTTVVTMKRFSKRKGMPNCVAAMCDEREQEQEQDSCPNMNNSVPFDFCRHLSLTNL